MTESITTVQGTLEHLDPAGLALEGNVRDAAALDPGFVASIREHGVMVPIVAGRGADGVVRVRAGQRRTLAAREAGLPSVPVYVRPTTGGDEMAETVTRIAEQIVENDQRQALTDGQRVRGIQQMIDAGASATRIAKKLSVSRDTVAHAKTAAASATALGALDEGQLSLAEAAALTEFDGDPDAIARLLGVAGTPRFEHKVAEIRAQRATAAAHAQAAAQYADQGYAILGDYPRYGDPACVELRYLRTADGHPATDDALADPAHWAVHLQEQSVYVDRETGEEVDDDDIDWTCRFSATREPDDGKHHPDAVIETTVFAPQWYCLDHNAAGLTLCDTFAKRINAIARQDTDSGDEDAAAKAAADRAQRRTVIALNKLADAAQTVRRQFITEKLLARKTPPKGTAIFLAHCLTRDVRLIEEHRAGDIAAELLGVAGLAAVTTLVEGLPATGDGRAQVLTLAMVLGALEARTPKDAWRSVPGLGYVRHVGPAELLGFLAQHGYELSDVEQVMTGQRTADEVFAAITGE